MGSSGGIRFRRRVSLVVILLVACLGGTARAREAQPLPEAAAGTRRAPERHGLSLDFYAKTCPAVDQIVANVTAARYRDFPAARARRAPPLPPRLLRRGLRRVHPDRADGQRLGRPRRRAQGGARHGGEQEPRTWRRRRSTRWSWPRPPWKAGAPASSPAPTSSPSPPGATSSRYVPPQANNKLRRDYSRTNKCYAIRTDRKQEHPEHCIGFRRAKATWLS
ncbi:hypothetical protein C2845_PM07G17320 [Panicum miliaceum]|uniref:Plant heme peroxidase family profile domain-containing protein n=1 Tax=Panicum miliaceum TaxID=4540 RepID=A0A3L6SJM4_PANMI|nr:hypothetical protein C2845_PM07G17320 [Panicum miliaceum]